jgi:hypothetical protein
VSIRRDGLEVDSNARAWELTTPRAPLGATSGGSQARALEYTNNHQQPLSSENTASERAGCVVPQGCEPAQPAAGAAGGPVANGKRSHERDAKRSGSRQYKDKSPRALADQREGSPEGAQVAATQSARRLRAHEAPKLVIPKHVQNCWHQNRHTPWAIYSWKRSNPSVKTRRPYCCRSWRCSGCARHEAAVTFARIRDAFAALPAMDCVFLVLTLDRDGYLSGKPWSDTVVAYKALSKMSEAFLKRVRRWMERETMKPVGSEWVAVVGRGSRSPPFGLAPHEPARLLTGTCPVA